MSSDRGDSQGSPLPLAPKGKELLMLRSIEILPQLLSPFFFFPKGWYNSFIAKYQHLCYSVIYTTLSFCSLRFKNLLLFIGGIVALQYCVSFWCTMKWTSYMYTYIPSLLDLPPQHWPPPYNHLTKLVMLLEVAVEVTGTSKNENSEREPSLFYGAAVLRG